MLRYYVVGHYQHNNFNPSTGNSKNTLLLFLTPRRRIESISIYGDIAVTILSVGRQHITESAVLQDKPVLGCLYVLADSHNCGIAEESSYLMLEFGNSLLLPSCAMTTPPPPYPSPPSPSMLA